VFELPDKARSQQLRTIKSWPDFLSIELDGGKPAVHVKS
jgi:hypothetical protein